MIDEKKIELMKKLQRLAERGVGGEFVKGRLKFGNSKQAAPFPSMVVIFRGAGM